MKRFLSWAFLSLLLWASFTFATIAQRVQTRSIREVPTMRKMAAVGAVLTPRTDDVISVRDYGADSTGVADSTTAIQAAIDVCGAAGGGIVYLPEGTYKIIGGLVIHHDGVKLCGAGEYGTLLYFVPTANATLLTLSKPNSGLLSSVAVSNLHLYSPDETYTKIAIDCNDINCCLFENLKLGGGHIGAVIALGRYPPYEHRYADAGPRQYDGAESDLECGPTFCHRGQSELQLGHRPLAFHGYCHGGRPEPSRHHQ